MEQRRSDDRLVKNLISFLLFSLKIPPFFLSQY